MPGIILKGKRAPARFGFLAVMLCFFAGGFVHAGGKADAAEVEQRNKEWVLCVTAFDLSALSPGRRLVGEVLSRELLEFLKLVEYRMRMEGEYAYYEEYAWSQSRGEAAKLLAAKRNERDQYIYRGDPDWKYRSNLKTVDEEIKKLEERLVKAEGETPSITTEPIFQLANANHNGVFPAPPKTGEEYRFCRSQQADAFLSGAVSEFHGRIYISVKMYTVYTRSFQYEDSIIFSTEDSAAALDELAGRLVAMAAGANPAFIAVHAEPANATVVINGAFAGRGIVASREHPPGEVTVEVFADEYGSVLLPVFLQAGEVAELYINLQPISRQALTIDVPEKPGTSVYRGALYLGEVPYTLTMPSNESEYFRVETLEGETGGIVVQGTGRGLDNPPIFDVRTTMPPGEGERPVNKSRQQFYGAYGRFWIALPVAFILGGVYAAYLNAYNRKPTESMYEDTQRYYYFSTGATVLAGVALTETFYRIYRYVNTSGKNTTPAIVR